MSREDSERLFEQSRPEKGEILSMTAGELKEGLRTLAAKGKQRLRELKEGAKSGISRDFGKLKFTGDMARAVRSSQRRVISSVTADFLAIRESKSADFESKGFSDDFGKIKIVSQPQAKADETPKYSGKDQIIARPGDQQKQEERQLPGAEIALAALIASAGMSRARPDALKKTEKSDEGKVKETSAPENMSDVIRTLREGPSGDSSPGMLRFAAATGDFNVTLGENGAIFIDKLSNEDVADFAKEDEDKTDDQGILRRPTYLIQPKDTLVEIAEEFFHDANVGWLIADINQGRVKESWVNGKRVIELHSRQEIELPVWADIVEFHEARPEDAKPENLVTIVVETRVDKELLEGRLGSTMGGDSHAQNKPDKEL